MTTTVARARHGAGRSKTPARPPVPTGNAELYRHSVWLVGAFALAAVVAFWPSYFARLAEQPTLWAHAHGVAMSLWCAMLVAQAWLVRGGRRAVHRQLGVASYALVPAIVVATLGFLHARVGGVADLGAFGLYFLALVLNALVAFLLIYGLAMYHRRRAGTHARYMIGTIFPLFTPVSDRLFAAHMPSIVPLVPRIDGSPILPVAGFVLADAILIALAVWDWRRHARTDAFPTTLAIVAVYQLSVLTFYRFEFWNAVGRWFVTL